MELFIFSCEVTKNPVHNNMNETFFSVKKNKNQGDHGVGSSTKDRSVASQSTDHSDSWFLSLFLYWPSFLTGKVK